MALGPTLVTLVPASAGIQATRNREDAQCNSSHQVVTIPKRRSLPGSARHCTATIFSVVTCRTHRAILFSSGITIR